MKMSHFGVMSECRATEELRTFLNIRYRSCADGFRISGKEADPCIALPANNEQLI